LGSRRKADGGAGENGHEAAAARREETNAGGGMSAPRSFTPVFVAHRFGTGLAMPWQGQAARQGNQKGGVDEEI